MVWLTVCSYWITFGFGFPLRLSLFSRDAMSQRSSLTISSQYASMALSVVRLRMLHSFRNAFLRDSTS